jgi:ADP-ribosylglycohydrolase
MNKYIYNTFLAGWCAETIGARLEFQKRKFTHIEVSDAIFMIGPNSSGIYPGQITDDSEMEIALLSALIEGQYEEYFPLEIIAKKYIEWYHTMPFDIGQTTTFALLDATNATDMLINANEFNMDSESNGSLMRCIPIAVFGINKEPQQIMNMALLETELTHPNKIVGEITGIYCIIISQILHNKINNKPIDIDKIMDNIVSLITENKVLEWFNMGNKLTKLDNYDCITNEGHVKHAFIFVIYFLHNIHNYTYINAITEVIKQGGDTDTNAKIIGNLFGAYYDDCVPKHLSELVLNFNCTDVGNEAFVRPYSCSVNYAIECIKKLNF